MIKPKWSWYKNVYLFKGFAATKFNSFSDRKMHDENRLRSILTATHSFLRHYPFLRHFFPFNSFNSFDKLNVLFLPNIEYINLKSFPCLLSATFYSCSFCMASDYFVVYSFSKSSVDSIFLGCKSIRMNTEINTH